jgi:hypothetical protein
MIEEMVMDQMVKHAIQDATQSWDIDLRREALAWLQVCCPDIADQMPSAGAETLSMMVVETIDLHQKAAAYLERYPAW